MYENSEKIYMNSKNDFIENNNKVRRFFPAIY